MTLTHYSSWPCARRAPSGNDWAVHLLGTISGSSCAGAARPATLRFFFLTVSWLGHIGSWCFSRSRAFLRRRIRLAHVD